jgi:hypothetical protein
MIKCPDEDVRRKCRTDQWNQARRATRGLSDVIALVVLWRLRYKLALSDLPGMFLIRGRDRLKPEGWYRPGRKQPVGIMG